MMYTAIILNKASRKKLINRFISIVSPEYTVYAHHMTINMGSIEKGPLSPSALGKKVSMLVTSFAANDLVMAVGVDTLVPSNNKIKHVTLAVNLSKGGKPAMSNKLQNWEKIADPIEIFGTIMQVV